MAPDHFGEFLVLGLDCEKEFVSIKVMVNLKVVYIILLQMHLTQIKIKHHQPLVGINILVDIQILIHDLPEEVNPVLLVVEFQSHVPLEVLLESLSYLLQVIDVVYR